MIQFSYKYLIYRSQFSTLQTVTAINPLYLFDIMAENTIPITLTLQLATLNPYFIRFSGELVIL